MNEYTRNAIIFPSREKSIKEITCKLMAVAGEKHDV